MATEKPEVDRPLRVLFVAAEADPFIKVGGLGDVGGSLPRALRTLSLEDTGGRLVDTRLVIPLHGGIDQTTFSMHAVASYPVPTSTGSIQATAYATELGGLPVYLLSGAPIIKASSVYSLDTREDGPKYTFFSLAALELPRQLGWKPDIIHANDWHTALCAYQLAALRERDPFYKNTRSVLTLHNLPFMGIGAEGSLAAFNILPPADDRLPEWARQAPLPLGLLTADRIVAVSPTYAREILTEELGCGLSGFLKTRTHQITGILNGIDTIHWDPSRGQDGIASYTADRLEMRSVNKTALQNRFSFNESALTPLIVFIGRMDPQKGIDLAFNALRLISDLDWQAIILGTGVPALEAEARELENAYPDRVRAVLRFDARLSQQLYAGADLLLMPSRYEPCGLAQMIAMRYGCIPVARATGGLRDTVRDISSITKSTGFLFESPTAAALAETLQQAIFMYPNQAAWQGLQRRGMAQDFSWRHSAEAYARLYLELLKP